MKPLWKPCATLGTLACSCLLALADGPTDAMQQKLEALEKKVEVLETKLSDAGVAGDSEKADTAKQKALFGLGSQSDATFHLGAYGEMKYGSKQTTTGWHDGFDAGRFVLLPTWQLADNIILNAEIEFEHGGFAGGADDKRSGSAEIEQAYIDFKFNDHVNWRAPGIDVVPFGYTNLHHEPTQFYSVDRPELYNGLIPSTWAEGATSVYGNIVDNLDYQFQINTGLEDTQGTGSTPAGTYTAGISGTDALSNSRSPVGDFSQTKNSPGFATRLAYTLPWVPGLAGSTSVFHTSNITPRDAHDDLGNPLGDNSLTMFDTELRYRIPKSGFELRGEYVSLFFSNPSNLRANNDSDATNNVGHSMWGASGEAAYHWLLAPKVKNGWEIVPFYRYTYEDFQTGGFAGSDANAPTGQGQKQFHTFGIAAFPTPQIVLKLNYQKALDNSPTGPKADALLGAVGFAF